MIEKKKKNFFPTASIDQCLKICSLNSLNTLNGAILLPTFIFMYSHEKANKIKRRLHWFITRNEWICVLCTLYMVLCRVLFLIRYFVNFVAFHERFEKFRWQLQCTEHARNPIMNHFYGNIWVTFFSHWPIITIFTGEFDQCHAVHQQNPRIWQILPRRPNVWDIWKQLDQ